MKFLEVSLVFGFSLLCSAKDAQSLSPIVLAAGGGNLNGGNAAIEWILGEPFTNFGFDNTLFLERIHMLLAKDISAETFNNMVGRFNLELMNVNNEIEILETSECSIKDYVDSRLELLANLDHLFMESDYDGKRILAGSLFTKKLVFGNNGCRTAEVNEVLDVLTRNSKAFEGSKNEKAAKNDSFSAIVEEKSGLVAPAGQNSNEILEDTRDLVRIWDLYGYLINE